MSVWLDSLEKWVAWIGGLAILITLGAIFYGIWRGLRQPLSTQDSLSARLLRSPVFYVFASLGYFGLCYLLWRPLPLAFSPPVRLLALACGALLFFPGLALVLWGRLALGKWYNVSTTLGAPLYANQRLVTSGPYALLRHPMYLGLLLTGLGGVLIYRTWTMAFFSLNFVGLMLRARREEQALAAKFGEQWQAYRQQVPRWIPALQLERWEQLEARLPPGLAVLLEIGLMFLPAIPAYIWLWPNVSGTNGRVVQSLAYLYVLAGTLFIGLRRWSLSQLGLNWKGIGLSLVCGLALLGGRLAMILSIDWELSPPRYSTAQLALNILFYFGLVGLVEELLYRGLIYHALETWLGVRWAIWGSSTGFLLWHIFGQGPLIGAATLLIGLIFAQIRWRAGGILGLILLHGLWDLEGVLLVSNSNAEILSHGRPEILNPVWMWSGLALLVLTPVYLWKIHPLLLSRLHLETG